MTREERKQTKRLEIMKAAEKYRDVNGNIDLSKMRIEENKTYGKISYYFGNIDEFIIEMNSGKNEDTAGFDTVKAGAVRNQLAFSRLSVLRDKQKLSYDELGNTYNKSKMHMNKLYRELEISTLSSDNGTTLNRPVVRNQLAYEMMNYLIKEEKMSFEIMGAEYNVSAEYLEMLYKDWTNLFPKANLGESNLKIALA